MYTKVYGALRISRNIFLGHRAICRDGRPASSRMCRSAGRNPLRPGAPLLLETRGGFAPERYLEAANQALLVEGLAQEADGSGLEHAHADALLREGRDKYDWGIET